MCLIIFAYQAEPRYPLVVAANRDEFYARPTAEADFWESPSSLPLRSQVLAGRDLQAGGTWLGIAPEGRFAAVTNIFDPSRDKQKVRSRGDLPKGFLIGSLSPEEYFESIHTEFDQFAGFNLLLGDSKALYYANNIEGVISQLEPGIYGLSNGLLNDNQPRVERGEKKLKSLLDPDHKLDTDLLIRMMADKEVATDQELSSKPVTFKLEGQLSSTFIVDQEQRYGTRCSTAVIRNEMGNVRFCEQNYDSSGKPTGCNFFELRAMPTK